MMKQGKCYKCGGFLAVDDAEDAAVCPFCSKPIIVEKAIQSFQETTPQYVSKIPKSASFDTDFVVQNDVLMRCNSYTKTDIHIPEGITAIGDAAFQGMCNIETVHIPATVKNIGSGAFSGCRNLQSILIEEGVEIFDRDVFNGCTALQSIRFPESVRKLESGVFNGCTALTSVNIPEQVEILPWRVFEGCTALTTIVIPKKVTTIEDYAFADCTALEEVRFACLHAESGAAVGVRRIGMNAFLNCTALKRIDMPDTLEFIGNQAFRGCERLISLLIPASVKAIYPLAFADCTGLESVTFAGNTKLYKGSNPYKSGSDVATFYNCPKLLGVHYSELQVHFWAFPAYMKAQSRSFVESGRCRYCGGEFTGTTEKICAVCEMPKDY